MIKACSFSALLGFLILIFVYREKTYAAYVYPKASLRSCRDLYLKSDFPLIPMHVLYRGESESKWGRQENLVRYFSRQERVESAIYIKDGLVLDHQYGPITTNRIEDPTIEKPNIFVIDQNFQMYFYPRHEKQVIHHSSIIGGEPVRFAGSLIVEKGQVIEIIARSGHYKPTIYQTLKALYWLHSKGLELNNVYISGPVIEEAYGVKSILITKILGDSYREVNRSYLGSRFKSLVNKVLK